MAIYAPYRHKSRKLKSKGPAMYIRNNLTGKKEQLNPLRQQHIGMYACGVTTYDECHIGHAMQAIFFDVMRNLFESQGFAVTYVRNFTDVDDKIIARAKQLNISPKLLAERMVGSSQEDMLSLGIRPASFEPRVSETIPEIIAMISQLISKGLAYSTSTGDVYYRVKEKKDYGKLSHRKVEELLSQTRELSGLESKEDSLDFALWKKDETPDASWDSPWGRGRPGWHIECSAMAKKFLGDSFDIHGGGRDLIFPHHENEIAQSESANGCPYASVWIHSGLLTVDKQKMSKSLGNFITIKDFLKEWHPEILRFCYLQNHYASNIDFSLDLFKTCRRRLIYFYETLFQLSQLQASHSNPTSSTDVDHILSDFEKQFDQAMEDDFNTPVALGEVNKFFKWLNQKLSEKNWVKNPSGLNRIHTFLEKVSTILGVFKDSYPEFLASQKSKILIDLGLSESQLNEWIAQRVKAREEKNWAQSDQIRDTLLAKGLLLRDGADGTTWTVSY